MSNKFEAAIHEAAEVLSAHILALGDQWNAEQDTLSDEEGERLLDTIDNIQTVRTSLFEWLEAFDGADA